jgi:creatinine amidohydrolase
LVLPLEEAGDGHEKKSTIKGIREKWAWAERKWSQVTEDTGIGNPKKANPEKVQHYFDAVTDKVADLMVDICAAKPDELYR